LGTRAGCERLSAQTLKRFPWETVGAYARVDLLRLSAGCTQAIRLRIEGGGDGGVVRGWARRHGVGIATDAERYMALAPDEARAREVLRIDASVEPHALELGALLGYPPCCAREVARIGEEAIDAREREIARWNFTGEWDLIDPSRYRRGEALVSHLPCSPRCEPSRGAALRAHVRLAELVEVPAYAAMSAWAATLCGVRRRARRCATLQA
jgi:hypothetical protein